MAKVLCVLYDDPIDGYPTSYASDDILTITAYPGPDDADSKSYKICTTWRSDQRLPVRRGARSGWTGGRSTRHASKKASRSPTEKRTGGVSASNADIASVEQALSAKYGWQFRATKLLDGIKRRLGQEPIHEVVAVHISIPE